MTGLPVGIIDEPVELKMNEIERQENSEEFLEGERSIFAELEMEEMDHDKVNFFVCELEYLTENQFDLVIFEKQIFVGVKLQEKLPQLIKDPSNESVKCR